MVLAPLKICHDQDLDKYIGIPYEVKCMEGSNSLKGEKQIHSIKHVHVSKYWSDLNNLMCNKEAGGRNMKILKSDPVIKILVKFI